MLIFVDSIATMIRPYWLWICLLFTVCSFCRRDFVSLGRHAWRCKNSVNNRPYQSVNSGLSNNSQIIPPIVSNESNLKCCYGKQCKGMKRLKMHQRKCRVIFGFEDENLVQFLDDDTPLNAETNQTSADDMPISHLIRKDGILLPKSDKDWSIANNFVLCLQEL